MKHTKKHFPDCWWITPDIPNVVETDHLLQLLAEKVSQGFQHIQFRQTQLNDNDFAKVFFILQNYCHEHALTLIVNGDAALAKKLNAEGCYLNADVLMKCQTRPLSHEYWVGAYCHDLDELLHAEKIDLDFVSLSPVQKTLTHPEQIPLGWEKFQQLVLQTRLPVYALGGMALDDKATAISHNAQGIMGIRFSKH